MRHLLHDLRSGFRLFVRYPGVSFLAVAALALGIHLVATQLMVIDAMLFRGPALPNADRLVDIARADEESGPSFHPDDLRRMRAAQSSLDALGGYYEGTVNVGGVKEPLRFQGAFITWDFLRAIGVEPIVGRGFSAEDAHAQAPLAVLISERVWRREFGASHAILERPITINNMPATVVGVMPAGVNFPIADDVWVPLREPAEVDEKATWVYVSFLRAFGLLKPGVSAEAARADLNALVPALAEASPEYWTDMRTIEVSPYHRGVLPMADFEMLWIMLLAVSFVLLVACANVTNLLLARSTARSRELAVRAAVGASRRRLIAQLLAECLALCLAGGALGLLLCLWTVDGINAWIASTSVPYWVKAEVDGRIVAAVFAICLLCACVAGALPALRASKVAVLELLSETGRTATNLHVGWFGRTVVAVQVATAFALLVVAGMMVRTVPALRDVELPRPTSAILSARFGLFEGADGDNARRVAFLENLVARLRADVRVEAAALTDRQQFDALPTSEFVLESDGGEVGVEQKSKAFLESVSTGYFEALGTAPVRGRAFEPADLKESRPVAIVNESFVRAFLREREPLGTKLVSTKYEDVSFTIVGVVPDLSMNGTGVNTKERAGIYVPANFARDRFFTVVLAARSGDAARLAPLLRETVRELDPDLPLYWVQTYAAAIDKSLATIRVMTSMFVAFGIAAVFLAAIGIYGVAAFVVTQRTPEIGIRMALGATPKSVVGLFARQGAWQLVVGLACGALLAVGLDVAIRRDFAATADAGAPLFAVVALVMAFVVLCASIQPARRAVRLSPLEAMRQD
ncbi:ABC transporter permease [Opitutales bacterium ASA1]|uniref:ADOP family duplicated permease n=1 Tax=Congregicoccus parvus TaxID=3081749 RepID=UPI002B2D82B8|nr:ABC transporter permease [Opitutales bacterium ASA1]